MVQLFKEQSHLRCVVAGSFEKFKKEIDLCIDEFQDFGVMVLAPEKGWVFKPPQRLYRLQDRIFRPLPKEMGMSARQIEDSFLEAILNSDFVYVVNPDGYVGNTVSFEIGFAIALGIPVYAQQLIDTQLDPDAVWLERCLLVQSFTPQQLLSFLSMQTTVGNSSR